MKPRIPVFLTLCLLSLGLMLLYSCQPLQQNVVAQTTAPRFSIPIDCNLGKDCFILLYPDRDPSPQAVDFGCGRQTYDTHKGTDFAIPDQQTMVAGVPVVAAAGGEVLRVRDGVIDRRIKNQTDKASVKGTECGNGLVIDHSEIENGDGWQTQYCHLRQGSVAVKPGDRVKAGTLLGYVGMSGLASFPHVHLTIRYQGEVVDPFVGPDAATGCNVNRNSLWQQPLGYEPTGIIRAGFAAKPPNMDQLWQGQFTETVLSADIPTLLFWVQAYGVLKGDKIEYQLQDPEGKRVVENQDTIDSSAKTWIGYVGKKNTPQRPLKPGTWQGKYRLIREGKVIINIQRKIQLQ